MAKQLSFIFFLLSLITSQLFAHSDDEGEIHPIVRAEEGKFAIYYQKTDWKCGLPSGDLTYKLIFDVKGKCLDGELLEPLVHHKVFLGERLRNPDGDLVKRVENTKNILFSQYTRFQKEICFWVLSLGEKWTKIKLRWTLKEPCKIKAVIRSKEYYALITETSIETKTYPFYNLTYYLNVISRQDDSLLYKLKIGQPYLHLYGTWLISIQLSGDNLYFTWNELHDEQNNLVSYNLSRVNLKTKKLTTKSVAIGGANTVPTVAVIDDTALFAYHKPTIKMEYERSVTKLVDGKTIFTGQKVTDVHYWGKGSKSVYKFLDLKECCSEDISP